MVEFTRTPKHGTYKITINDLTPITATISRPITVISTDPANGTVNVPLNKTIIVTFSDNILAGSDYDNITVKLSNGSVKTIIKVISGKKTLYKSNIRMEPRPEIHSHNTQKCHKKQVRKHVSFRL